MGKMIKAVIIALALMMPLSAAALAQTQTQTQTPADPRETRAPTQSTTDPPLGFPYNTGNGGVSAEVPLRDFLSSRQDQQRAELIERIESLSRHMQQIIDERDRQYAQRFAAQQDAVEAALASQKELSAQALAAAKEAVDKAEGAANDRFNSVNEFRSTLSDQASNFVNKSTAEARFNALEEKVNSVYDRLNASQNKVEGSANAWGGIITVISVLIAAGGLVVAFVAILLRGGRRENT